MGVEKGMSQLRHLKTATPAKQAPKGLGKWFYDRDFPLRIRCVAAKNIRTQDLHAETAKSMQ
jgi:hypothetical protein